MGLARTFVFQVMDQTTTKGADGAWSRLVTLGLDDTTQERIDALNESSKANGLANRALLLCQYRGHTMHVINWTGTECFLECFKIGSDFSDVKAVSYSWSDAASTGVSMNVWCEENSVPTLDLCCKSCGMRAQNNVEGLDVRCLPPGKYWIDHLCSRFDAVMSDIYLSLVPYVKGTRVIVASENMVFQCRANFAQMKEDLAASGWADWSVQHSRERDMFLRLSELLHSRRKVAQRGWLVWEEAMAPATEIFSISRGEKSKIAHNISTTAQICSSSIGAIFRLCGLWNDDIEVTVRQVGLLAAEIIGWSQMFAHIDIIRACGEIGAGFAIRELVAQQVFESLGRVLQDEPCIGAGTQDGMIWTGNNTNTQWHKNFPEWHKDVGYLTLYEHIRCIPDLCLQGLNIKQNSGFRGSFQVVAPQKWCITLRPNNSLRQLRVTYATAASINTTTTESSTTTGVSTKRGHDENNQMVVTEYVIENEVSSETKGVLFVEGDAQKVRIYLWATVEAVLGFSPRHIAVL
eukprot:c3283_g1_i1.p1 GENE.c3283_g1_i1~~c3283_g1_i1.p1  ORF type:complete len:519 (+),score=102.17 c3283_g1_i1:1-1557(+)